MGRNESGARTLVCEVCRVEMAFNEDRSRGGRVFNSTGDGTYDLLCRDCQHQGYEVNHEKLCIYPGSPADHGSEEKNLYPYIKGMNAGFNPWSDHIPNDTKGASSREYGLRGYYRNKRR